MLARRLPWLLLFLFAPFLTPSLQAAVTTNVKVPVDIPVFIPCAVGGTGELVVLQGNLHVLLRFTMSASGTVDHGTRGLSSVNARIRLIAHEDSIAV